MFDVCTTGDTAHIDTIFKFLPHTRQHVDACLVGTWISYRCVPCHPWCTHRTYLVVKKKLFQFSCACEKFHSSFLVINVCNPGEHYETPCIWWGEKILNLFTMHFSPALSLWLKYFFRNLSQIPSTTLVLFIPYIVPAINYMVVQIWPGQICM